MTAFAYPPSARIRRKQAFVDILRGGRAHAGGECVVRVLPTRRPGARLGIAAPRRYGNAVRRNRFRRLVREAFRLTSADLGSFDYLVTPRRTLGEPTRDGIGRDLRAAHDGARAALERRASGSA